MRELEQRYPDTVAVIGVHSGKFIAERETVRIRDATIRLDATHPVVNDRQFRVWRSYAVRAWPTLVAIDARGRVVGQHAGEFSAGQLVPFLDHVIAAARAAGELAPGPMPLATDPPTHAPGVLRFPGKIAVAGDRIAVADTGHHRILVGHIEAGGRRLRVAHVVGSGSAGFADGAPGAFRAPQGVAFAGETLYVADAGNHAVRAVDLRDGAVRTVAGTGTQLRTRDDLARGALSSPWDVAVVGGTLFVAMAGTHQIYAIRPATGAVGVHAGNRHEEIQDGPLLDAALAQPMGIAAGARGELVVADSETSAIRRCDSTPEGRVETLIGTGLFDFGDRDGTGEVVRLQHAQGVAWHGDGRVLIADSYNDALRWLDPRTRSVRTWVRGLHEPGGVACGERAAWVADTNAHRICRVDYATGEVVPVDVAL